jgi:hypothetical protein
MMAREKASAAGRPYTPMARGMAPLTSDMGRAATIMVISHPGTMRPPLELILYLL